jgi:two-component sensor histidine kinase
MKGLYLLENNSIKYLSKQTGLPSNEVLSLFYDSTNNSLIIGTSNGISILDIDNFDHYQPKAPKVIVAEVKAGDSTYTNYNNLIFNPEQHDISIDFQAIHFSSPGSVTYKYSLNNDWLTTDYNSLNFISLKNGTYNLKIIAKAQNTLWSEPYVLSFSVLPRFTETTWFYLLMIFLLVITGLFILMLSLKLNTLKANKELALTERINELKHQALSAMMNPHFIANSLNSVQYLVNSRKYEDANNYIAMMAKLMRKNLDTAGKGFIRLSDEIDRLKLYLDIEKLRFQESFSYEITTGADLETNSILIPNMIIQPFVENSLWHGIINSGKSGMLTVAFTFEKVDIDSVIGRSLIIKITDNGIGINEASKHKKEDHISKGIHIIEERLRLLSTKMNLTQPIVFEDLSVTDPEAHGTEVIISLPPPLYKVTNRRVDPYSSVTV